MPKSTFVHHLPPSLCASRLFARCARVEPFSQKQLILRKEGRRPTPRTRQVAKLPNFQAHCAHIRDPLTSSAGKLKGKLAIILLSNSCRHHGFLRSFENQEPNSDKHYSILRKISRSLSLKRAKKIMFQTN